MVSSSRTGYASAPSSTNGSGLYERAQPPSARSQALLMNAFGATDRGLVRDRNEDQFVIATLTGTLWVHQSTIPQARVRCAEPIGHLLVVADGMGGHAGGETASALAVGAVEDFVLTALGWLFRLEDRAGEPEGPPSARENNLLDELKTALRRADATVSETAARNPEVHGMGTTLTLAYSIGQKLYVAHAGDTRCYLLRQGRLRAVTSDHTLVREMVDAGVIRPEDVPHNQFRHVVTNVVGGGSQGIKAEVHRLELAPGDTVLLSSDGLHDSVDDDLIQRILEAAPSPERACAELVEAAKDAGGRDNITCIVARFDPAGPRRIAG